MKALILSGIPWNTTLQRHHKIAKWLKQLNFDVTFVEGIPSSKFTIKKFFVKIKSKIINSNSTIENKKYVKVVNGGFLPPNKCFYLYNRFKIKKLLNILDEEYDIIINYLPIQTTDMIINSIKYKSLIYDCVRDFSNFGGYLKNTLKYENKLIKKSNIILTDSYYLTNKFGGEQILPSLSLEQYKVFKTKVRPKTISKVLYFGGIGEHIDLDVLKLISQKYEFHFIGRTGVNLDFNYVDHGYFSDPIELAKEIIKCDAIIIPYKGNMNGVIPAKFVEAIASNLPVFIKSFYDSEKLKNLCYVYKDNDELISMIDNYSPNDLNNEEISTFVLENLEENQFEKFKSIIQKL